jgi:hypothetical protein
LWFEQAVTVSRRPAVLYYSAKVDWLATIISILKGQKLPRRYRRSIGGKLTGSGSRVDASVLVRHNNYAASDIAGALINAYAEANLSCDKSEASVRRINYVNGERDTL